LTARIANMAPGTTIHLKVFRGGKTFDVAVTLAPGSAYANQEQNEGSNGENGNPESAGKALEGVQLETLTPDIAQQLNLPSSTKGVVVENVDQGSAAAQAGVQQGDVIQEVNHKPVSNMSDLRSALTGASGNQPVLLLVIPPNQPGFTQYLLIEPNS
jgi:serine protease Do